MDLCGRVLNDVTTENELERGHVFGEWNNRLGQCIVILLGKGLANGQLHYALNTVVANLIWLMLLTLGAHAQQGLLNSVCVCVCLLPR